MPRKTLTLPDQTLIDLANRLAFRVEDTKGLPLVDSILLQDSVMASVRERGIPRDQITWKGDL